MLFAVAACAPPPTEGVVVQKIHEPARTYQTVLLVPRANGGYTYIPQMHYDDEDWVLVLETDAGRRRAYVTSDEFARAEVGHFIDGLGARQFNDRDREMEGPVE